jgi:arylsulfatase A-like enzyme
VSNHEALFRWIDTALPNLSDTQLAQYRALYYGEVAYADHYAGRILDLVRERFDWNETIVAVLADHGELLGEFGAFGHTLAAFPQEIDIPLVVSDPSLQRAVRVSTPCGIGEVAGTLLRLAGVDPGPAFPSSCLDPGRTVAAVTSRRFLFGDSDQAETGRRFGGLHPWIRTPDVWSIEGSRHRVVFTPRMLLGVYAIDDPMLRVELSADPSTQDVQALAHAQQAAMVAAASAPALSEEQRRALHALGYL